MQSIDKHIEEYMIAYLSITSIVFLFFGIIWENGNFMNAMLKMFIIVMAIWGGILLLNELGLVVKAPEGMRWF